jgi:Flp pilus assembly pilin Flp
MGQLRGLVGRFLHSERAAGIVEYSILVMLVAMVTLVVLTVFGENVSSNLDNRAANIANLDSP